jgi:hypothetical protein
MNQQINKVNMSRRKENLNSFMTMSPQSLIKNNNYLD